MKKLKLSLKILIIILFIAVIALLINCARVIINNRNVYDNMKSTAGQKFEIEGITEEVEIKDVTFSMAVIGDIMCHNTQFQDAYENGVYDFSYVFDDVRDELTSADITVRKP